MHAQCVFMVSRRDQDQEIRRTRNPRETFWFGQKNWQGLENERGTERHTEARQAILYKLSYLACFGVSRFTSVKMYRLHYMAVLHQEDTGV